MMKCRNQKSKVNVLHNVNDLKTSNYYLLKLLKFFHLINNNSKCLHNDGHLKSNELLELILFNHYIINILSYNLLLTL